MFEVQHQGGTVVIFLDGKEILLSPDMARALAIDLEESADSCESGMMSGPTGLFPEGKINEDDEGQLQLQVGVDMNNGVVVMDFGTKVAWFGMNPTTAIGIGETLIEQGHALTRYLKSGGDA